MGKTEDAASKSELVEDVRNEVIGEFKHTDIVLECNRRNNIKTLDALIIQNEEFQLKRQKFLKECHEKGIFIEGLIASVFMDDSNLIDVFESGIAKAANFSELGDVQAVTSVVAQWCMKLHTKPGKKRSQKVAWLETNGLKETKLKEIDKQLRARYKEVVALVSDLKTPTLLNFNKNVQLVHETMVELMAKLWFHRLCIYQGHKDLGYMQISSKVPSLIGKKSCYRLTNEPPRFVLALDTLIKDRIPDEVNVLVCIEEDLAASILSKYHNTTVKDIVDQFYCITGTTKYMNFELGCLASSENFCERLKSICGPVMKVIYDSDLKQLKILCPKVGCGRIRSVLMKEIKSLKTELEVKQLEIPFPNIHSSLRIQVGEGLQCLGITGFQWYRGEQLREVRLGKHAIRSDFSGAAESTPTHKNYINFAQTRIEDLCSYQHVLTSDDAIVYESYTESLTAKQKNIFVDDIFVLDTSVEVILNCLKKDKVKDERRRDVLMPVGDAKSIVISCVIRVLAGIGLSTDGRENSIAIAVQANSDHAHAFELKIIFPNVYAARTGVECLESISRSDFSVCFKHPEKLRTDLKRIRIMMSSEFYQIIEKPLQKLLGRLQRENIVDDWIAQDSISSVNPSNIDFPVSVTVTTRENCHMLSLAQNLESFFQPALVTVDIRHLFLQSNEGIKFLKFLMQFTGTCIRLPPFQQKAHIYGDPSSRKQSAVILKNQLLERYYPWDKSWHLLDFGKASFNGEALKNFCQKMRARLNELIRSGEVSQYVLLEDRPELWVEAKLEVFRRFSSEPKATLLRRTIVLIDKKSVGLECPVCFHRGLDTSRDDCYLLSVCGHAYCKDCVLQLIIQSAKDRKFPIKCVLRKCNRSLSAAELWYICGVVQYYDIGKMLHILLKSFIMDDAAAFGLCPKRNCRALCLVNEKDEMKVCIWCQGKFCLLCDGKFHGSRACGEAWSVTDWLAMDSKSRKSCPNCRIAIHKEYGCNVVFCSWCKKYICWTCGLFHTNCSEQCHAHTDNNCRSSAQ